VSLTVSDVSRAVLISDESSIDIFHQTDVECTHVSENDY